MDDHAKRFRERTKADRAWFRAALADARATQDKLRTLLLTANRDTAFGREHRFGDLNDLAAYRRAVPIRDYDGLAPWIERVAKGEESVLTVEKPVMFARTSGTSAEPKKIPLLRSDLVEGRTRPRHAMWAHLIGQYPEVLESPESVMDLMMDPRPASTFLAGIPYQGYSSRDFSLGEDDWDPPWTPTSRMPLDLTEYTDRIYYRLRRTIEANLRVIVTYNPSSLISLAEHLHSEKDRLIEELRRGTICGKPGRANPKRADELEALARCGEFTPSAVWPGLRFVLCWKSATAGMYLPKLAALFGRADVRPNYTSSSEGLIAVPVDDHPTAGLIAVTNAFYEFVPASEQTVGQHDALAMHELEIGKKYQIVMSLRSGFYRYAIGDVFEILEFVGGVPRVEFLGRSNVASSFTGEKLTEQQVHSAVDAALAAVGVVASNFTCCPRWDSPPYYELVVQPAASHVVNVLTLATLADEFDRQLSLHNEEYLAKRKTERLGMAKVRTVPARAFERFMQHCVAAGTMPSQYKLRVLQKDDTFLNVAQGPE